MPNYGIRQAGGVLSAIQPGDAYTLFNAESPTPPQASVAFARGYSPSADDAGITFQAIWAANATAQVDIQASEVDVDADYGTVGQIILAGATVNSGFYTDVGRSKFYRARLVSQSAGGALTVIASR